MSTQHTPGPWRVKPGANIVEAQFCGEWYALANIGILNINDLNVLLPYREQTPANARLIAVAPDLLAALKALTGEVRASQAALAQGEFIGAVGRLSTPTQRAVTAIAKAEEGS